MPTLRPILALAAASQAVIPLAAIPLAAIAVAAIPLAANALPVVPAGTDYLQTLAGTYDTLPGVGPVDFTGGPFGSYGADTIVQRLSDATINAGTAPPNPSGTSPFPGANPISLIMTGLQLASVGPVTIGAYTGAIFVSLDPFNLANDTGQMSVYGTSSGGTFDSTLNVFFDVCTSLGVNGVGCDGGTQLGTGNLTFYSNGAPWSSTPGPATNTGSRFYPGIQGGITEVPVSEQALLASHVVDPVPEPGTLALLGSALAGLTGQRLRRWRRRKVLVSTGSARTQVR